MQMQSIELLCFQQFNKNSDDTKLSSKNYCIVNIMSNTEHATMETLRNIVLIDKSVYESFTLNKITIMAILVMLYSYELVDIIGDTNDDFIHRICSL